MLTFLKQLPKVITYSAIAVASVAAVVVTAPVVGLFGAILTTGILVGVSLAVTADEPVNNRVTPASTSTWKDNVGPTLTRVGMHVALAAVWITAVTAMATSAPLLAVIVPVSFIYCAVIFVALYTITEAVSYVDSSFPS